MPYILWKFIKGKKKKKERKDRNLIGFQLPIKKTTPGCQGMSISFEVSWTTVLILTDASLPLFLIQKLLMMVSTSWSGCELKLNNLVKHVNECMVQNTPSISISSLPLLSPDRVSCIQEVLGLSCIYIVIESHVQSDSLIHLPHNRDNQTQRMWSPLVILGHGQVPTKEGGRQKGMGLGSDSSSGKGLHSDYWSTC